MALSRLIIHGEEFGSVRRIPYLFVVQEFYGQTFNERRASKNGETQFLVWFFIAMSSSLSETRSKCLNPEFIYFFVVAVGFRLRSMRSTVTDGSVHSTHFTRECSHGFTRHNKAQDVIRRQRCCAHKMSIIILGHAVLDGSLHTLHTDLNIVALTSFNYNFLRAAGHNTLRDGHTKWGAWSYGHRNTSHIPRAEKFGDLITADQKVLNEESESRNTHRYAVVVQDLAFSFIRVKDLRKFLEPSQKPKVIYTDNSLEFGKSCEELSWNHRTSKPHRSETNEIADRAVRRVKEGTSAVLLQSGLDEKW